MATEYSLLTCLGRDGQAVTMTIASPCVVTLNAHGMPDGHPIRFATTGALPTGLSLNTTYYVKSPAAGTFNVSATNGGAAVNTSGSQSGTHKAIGEYWATLPATDPGNGGNYRARYGAAGSERVYSSFYSLEAYLLANPDPSIEVVIEVQGKWDDLSLFRSPGAYAGFYSIVIHTKINGVRDPDAFHYGILGFGFRRMVNVSSYAAFTVPQANVVIDGLEIINQSTTGGWAIRLYVTTKCIVSNCIVRGFRGLTMETRGCTINNTLAVNCTQYGFNFIAGYGLGDVVNNCHATGCGVGFDGNNSVVAAIINCSAFGNTINWSAEPTGKFLGLNNAGIAGDPVWDSSATPTAIASLVDVDFDSNFKPASSSSHLVNAGLAFTGLMGSDITGNARPNYESASYPNNLWDIGPFEYDHGEGIPPQSVNINITGMASGSTLAIYKASDMSEIAAPMTTTGSYSATYTYTGDTNIVVRVRKGTSGSKYLPYEYAGTITSSGFSLNVSQILDQIA